MAASPSYLHSDHHHHHRLLSFRDSALQTLTTIIQLHLEKTLEKKSAIDAQKKHLHTIFLLFFLFLSLTLSSLLQPSPRLQCRHCWVPIALLSLAFLVFYVAVAQTLRCINEFKYQRRCHKLTLAVATERMKEVKRGEVEMIGEGGEVEVGYQEPPESYLGKFRRSWALYFGFLICTFGFMVSASVVVLCF